MAMDRVSEVVFDEAMSDWNPCRHYSVNATVMNDRGQILVIYVQCGPKIPKFHLAHHVTSQYDTTRSTCRPHAFWQCRACRTARLDALDTLNVSCRDVTSQVEFGLK